MPVLFALNAAAIDVGGSVDSALGVLTLHVGGLDALGVSGAAPALPARSAWQWGRRPAVHQRRS